MNISIDIDANHAQDIDYVDFDSIKDVYENITTDECKNDGIT